MNEMLCSWVLNFKLNLFLLQLESTKWVSAAIGNWVFQQFFSNQVFEQFFINQAFEQFSNRSFRCFRADEFWLTFYNENYQRQARKKEKEVKIEEQGKFFCHLEREQNAFHENEAFNGHNSAAVIELC